MKLSTKLILPVLAISLIAGSAFAVKQPAPIQPSLGNLLAVSACNIAALTASFVALGKFIPDQHSTLRFVIQTINFNYWLHREYQAVDEYIDQKFLWEGHQAIKNFTK